MRRRRNLCRWVAAALAALFVILFFGGCHRQGAPDKAKQQAPALSSQPASAPEPVKSPDVAYRLSPGDTIEITWFIRPRTAAQTDYVYKFDVGDEMTLEFLYDKSFNFSRMVRPDGRISIPLLGDLRVIDQTPEWLAKKVQGAFSQVLQNPLCSANVTKVGSKEDELKEAITTQTGRQKEIIVRPDGFLSFPIINDIYGAGRTVPEIYDEINRLYRKEYPNLETSVQLKGVTQSGVYVAGEVSRPGNYPVFQRISPIQAIALAGGMSSTGNLKKVIVITRDENRRPVRKVVNLAQQIKTGNLEDDVLIGQNSIVYVPKTAIAVGDQFVEQYINKLLMFQGYSLGFTYLLNDDDDDDNDNEIETIVR